jgi:NADH-quinone oxidoreductase subunit L
VDAVAGGIGRFSDRLRGLQTGFARSYALSMLVGAGLFAGAVLLAVMWR